MQSKVAGPRRFLVCCRAMRFSRLLFSSVCFLRSLAKKLSTVRHLSLATFPFTCGTGSHLFSFGNRFFVSLTVFFVLGLAFWLQRCANLFRTPKVATASVSVVLACFVFWNLGLMFQWGSHLIPARGAVSWGAVAYNQVFVVPSQISGQLHDYFFRRKEMMRQIEQRDVQQLHQQTDH